MIKLFETLKLSGEILKSFFLSAFLYILDRYKTQEVREKIISKDSYIIRYVSDQ